MPEFAYEPRTVSDKSALTEGWHPAFLVAITDEATPSTWKMAEKSPRMWRWHFGVWEASGLIGRHDPEHQTAPSSQTFSPGGQFQASKTYVWTRELLGRDIAPGERVNLDPLMPLPCRVKVRRNNEYANIIDLERYPEGSSVLTPALRATLAALMDPGAVSPPAGTASVPTPVAPPPSAGPAPAAPVRPGTPTPSPLTAW